MDPGEGGVAAQTRRCVANINEVLLLAGSSLERVVKTTVFPTAMTDFATWTRCMLRHSHPFVGGTALTESYGVGTAARMRGRYVAAFDGIHGWYWQNRTLEHVTLRLDASGGFTESMIFDSAGEPKRPIASLK